MMALIALIIAIGVGLWAIVEKTWPLALLALAVVLLALAALAPSLSVHIS